MTPIMLDGHPYCLVCRDYQHRPHDGLVRLTYVEQASGALKTTYECPWCRQAFYKEGTTWESSSRR